MGGWPAPRKGRSVVGVEALAGLPAQSAGLPLPIRYCHIDVDVYQSARDVLEWVWGRLCIGAIVVYDDYGFDGCHGVLLAMTGMTISKWRLTFDTPAPNHTTTMSSLAAT